MRWFLFDHPRELSWHELKLLTMAEPFKGLDPEERIAVCEVITSRTEKGVVYFEEQWLSVIQDDEEVFCVTSKEGQRGWPKVIRLKNIDTGEVIRIDREATPAIQRTSYLLSRFWARKADGTWRCVSTEDFGS